MLSQDARHTLNTHVAFPDTGNGVTASVQVSILGGVALALHRQAKEVGVIETKTMTVAGPWVFTPIGEVCGVHQTGGGGVVAVLAIDPEQVRYGVKLERYDGMGYIGGYAYGPTPDEAMTRARARAAEMNAQWFKGLSDGL